MSIDIIELNSVDKKIVKNLFDIHKEVFLEFDKMTEKQFEEEFLIDNRLYFVAKENGKEVGYIGAVNCVDFFEIVGIGVKKDFQRTGIGKKLLKSLFDKAKNMGIKQIFLEVDEKNEVAKNFYEKNEFVVTNIRKKYYKDNDAFVMVHDCF